MSSDWNWDRDLRERYGFNVPSHVTVNHGYDADAEIVTPMSCDVCGNAIVTLTDNSLATDTKLEEVRVIADAQETLLTSMDLILGGIEGVLPTARGPVTDANSLSVTLASNHGVIDVTGAVTVAGSATEAKQDDVISELGLIRTDTTSIDNRLATTNLILTDISNGQSGGGGGGNPSEAGSQGNAWNSDTVTSGSSSTSVDLRYVSKCMVMVDTDGYSWFKVQVSQNDSDWYDLGQSIDFNGSGSGCITTDINSRYARLQRYDGSGSQTVTASIVGKQ